MTNAIRRISRAALALAALLSAPSLGFAADGLQCSAFLHGRDGVWRAFAEGTVIGPDGPVHLQAGEALRPSESSAKGGIARALNDLCESR